MSTINYNLSQIKAVVFDVDGVLSSSVMSLHHAGKPMRTVCVKDSYALQLAVKHGLLVGIITGGNTPAIRQHFEYLGVSDIFMGASRKINEYQLFRDKHALRDEEILYMGDDIPDIEILQTCGLPCCPKDASPDVKHVSRYISHHPGGNGCVRDVVEQVLRAQDKWMTEKAHLW